MERRTTMDGNPLEGFADGWNDIDSPEQHLGVIRPAAAGTPNQQELRSEGKASDKDLEELLVRASLIGTIRAAQKNEIRTRKDNFPDL
jgi:hypothetical protein